MIQHANDQESRPKRVVVLGSKGFVGSAIIKHMQARDITCLAISREQVDFGTAEATSYISGILEPEDVVIIAAAQAPVKNHRMLLDNIVMMDHICSALEQASNLAQVIYISSDAVYQDSMEPMSESSFAAPTSLHGVMHLAREQMLASVVPERKLLHIRPTLIYGAGDPHNGYGPNQFFRLVKSKQPIKLFGQGEERRDHVHIDDVAKLVVASVLKGSYGVINAVTGHITSFAEVAKEVTRVFDSEVEIQHLPRKGPMPHNGYRAFDTTLCQRSFPEFKPTMLRDGVAKLEI